MRLPYLPLAALLLQPSLSAPSFTGEPDSTGKYWLFAEGITASFIPYGASISNLIITDKHGIDRDIVTGFDNASYYSIDPVHAHFGGVPGRYANRIKNSTFTLDNEEHHILPNEHPTPSHPAGVNTLHGGPNGWDYRNFTVVSYTQSSITFSLIDPDGSEGFPGEVISYITYTLSNNKTWDAKMVAIPTTKKTPIMLSSHTYWNLDGFANNETTTALNHTLWLPYSGQTVAVDSILIPTGDILPAPKGSVNDFWSSPKQIGEGFALPEIDGNCGGDCTGYDNCWLVNRPHPYDWRSEEKLVARLESNWSGIRLDIWSDQEAFQMYSCNGMNGSMPLKTTQGIFDDEENFPRTIPQYGCVVLEVQDWIDGINHPEWGRGSKQIFEPGGDPYVLQVRHRFSVDDA
ncbi:galactose mutarotase-like domain-containing protein [Apiosordaria backusii]|uniref:Galactose mutarotase-like domain-containing protein n=1 Tax=Apiosordaria backusii TaxID=314023 RepID=A0AA40EY47_9PEZI|nr:galactose mutarotase-like domain-containing protein [Apiosordaria backusii]